MICVMLRLSYRFLQHDGLADFVAAGVRLLAGRHELLQRVVTFLDRVPSLLLSSCVRFTPPFL